MEFLEFDSLSKSGALTSLKKSISPTPQNLPETPTTLSEMNPEPTDEIQLENQQPSVKSIAPLQVCARKRVPISVPMQIHESEPVRVLLSLAVNFGWSVQQFDVKNAFFYGDLEEEVYMEPPSGFDENFSGNKVCRLKKELYGLKQSPRAWFGRFTKTMLAMGYTQSQGDHTLFAKHSATVAYSKHGIFLSQRKNVLDLLKKTGTLGCIAYAISIVSQFTHDPKERHLQAVHRILRYLKATPRRGILFKKGKELALEAYTDADYAGSIIDGRPTSGYCTFLGGNLVTWRSKKQPVVAQSSAEAEFRAMVHEICELLWLKIILDDIRVKGKD
ncbi:UNVERIFIED_CONTAM: Retrovirus-related Pol polyprotein from transposon TNT 1-94 [Sesamum radiatum]|uniref:Retrovirus-related Pol polyprotein from transposon TNT 1-94 n=1 Tax=Sesamum radiatum TaxID=300843 RepID=A0AAW2S195_SESRA